MHILLAAIGGVLLQIAASLVGRVLTALGLGVAVYTGMSTSLDWLKAQAIEKALLLPPEILGMLSIMKVGESISLLFSAVLARMVINGMSSDTVKRWVTK